MRRTTLMIAVVLLVLTGCADEGPVRSDGTNPGISTVTRDGADDGTAPVLDEVSESSDGDDSADTPTVAVTTEESNSTSASNDSEPSQDDQTTTAPTTEGQPLDLQPPPPKYPDPEPQIPPPIP